VRRENLIGTYLHGPLLPKNAWLADRLIALALERRYGSAPELEPLDDTLELAALRCAQEVALRS
jgi:CobQ-like glutamine amidotransferase family enzyme